MDDVELRAADLAFHVRILEDTSYHIAGGEKQLDAETRRNLIAACSVAISNLSQLVVNLINLEQEEAETAQKSA